MSEGKNKRSKLNNKGFEKPELIIIIAVLAIIILIGIIIGSFIGKRKPVDNGTVTISYNSNGGTGEMNSSECRTGSNCILKNNKFKKEGYEFTGWSTSESETNKTYGINDTYQANEDATLYAVWELKEITITYDANGGTGQMESTKYTYGKEKVTLLENKFIKTGYSFSGWHIYNPTMNKWYGCTDENTTCTGTEKNTTLGWHNRNEIKIYYDNKNEWDTTSTQHDIICYAQWGENAYKIEYQLNGGINGKEAPTSGVYGSTITISNPTKEGFKFNGWTIKGTDAKLEKDKLTIGTSDIILIANWNAKASDYIQHLYDDSTLKNNHSLKKDNTSDQNIRYVGSNPKNYVLFNDELWRIIGLVNVNGSKKIKLVRNELLIDKASWDSSDKKVNTGQGVNEWTQADIMYTLNEYYAGNNSNCRYCNNLNVSSWETCQKNCNNQISKLSTAALNMIEQVTWNTGAITFGDSKRNTYKSIPSLTAYKSERSNSTGKQCISNYDKFCFDKYSRSTKWTGKIGLIYASDYGYASGATNCDLLNKKGQCKKDNWMHLNAPNIGIWTMTPAGWWNFNNAATYIDNGGYIGMHFGHVALGVRPTLYLKSNVTILSGDGTSSNPYKLGI